MVRTYDVPSNTRGDAEQRKRVAELLAIGAMFANGSFDGIPDVGVSGDVSRLLSDCRSGEVRHVAAWLNNHASVELKEGEKAKDAILRTVRENSQRFILEQKLKALSLKTNNPNMPISELLDGIRELTDSAPIGAETNKE